MRTLAYYDVGLFVFDLIEELRELLDWMMM